MELSKKLLQLGFSPNQASVYKALIELGQCKAAAIIKKTNLHRNIVYEALEVLVEKHLAFKTSKGGVALFQLSDANTLVQDAKSQLTTAQEIAHEINSLRQKSTHEIKLYEGVGGLQSVRAKTLNELAQETDPQKKELLVLGADIKLAEQYYNMVFKKNDEERAKLHIPARLLFPQNITNTHTNQVDASPLTQVKLLPQTMHDPTAIDIWKDNISIILNDIEPFIVSIKNQKLADSFRSYFETLWNQDTAVITGLEALKKLRYQKLHALKKGDQFSVLWGNYESGTGKELFPFFKEFHKERVKRGICLQYLGFEKDRELLLQEMQYAGDPELQLSELKFSDNYNESPMQIEIYPDSVVLFYWAKNEKAVAVDIQRRDIRDAMKLYFDSLWEQKVFVLNGIKNTKKLFHRKLDEMKAGEEIQYMWANYGDETKKELVPFFHDLQQKRAKKRVSTKVLGFERNRAAHDKNNLGNYEQKLIHEDINSPLEIDIYPDSLSLVHWGKEDTIAVDIQNKKIRDAMKLYFDSLWNQDTQLITGRENVEKLVYQKIEELRKDDISYVYGGQYGEKNPDHFFTFWCEVNTKRNEKGARLHMIGFEHIRKELVREVQSGDSKMERIELRFLNQELLTPALTIIYPTSALLILWDYDEAMAIETTRESARQMLLKHFQSLWNIAKK
ncbi:MAG TPA: helix-turn-helix domain-containing protein [Patescibacteria group bacterium]|nr:helix-turn-helix domain-containing protein [Patescibacteria group bacterium]